MISFCSLYFFFGITFIYVYEIIKENTKYFLVI